jgi:hypothetical protein
MAGFQRPLTSRSLRRLVVATFFIGSLLLPMVRVPSAGKDEVRLEMKASDLSLILDGIELTSVRRRPRYERPAAARAEPVAGGVPC